MNYNEWDYTFSSNISQSTTKNIAEFLKTQSSDSVKDFYCWLADNRKEFVSFSREYLITYLLLHEHFDVANELFNHKTYTFDKNIAQNCAFHLSLDFKENIFDYWNTQVKKLNSHEQSASYKKFWDEFLGYQFLNNDRIMDNLPNLVYVFDKAPFYIHSNYDIVNGYLISSRKEFFKSSIKNLDNDLSSLVLQQVAILCGTHYPQCKSTFEEEFQNFPNMLDLFNKTLLYQNLNNKFQSKPSSKQTKI